MGKFQPTRKKALKQKSEMLIVATIHFYLLSLLFSTLIKSLMFRYGAPAANIEPHEYSNHDSSKERICLALWAYTRNIGSDGIFVAKMFTVVFDGILCEGAIKKGLRQGNIEKLVVWRRFFWSTWESFVGYVGEKDNKTACWYSASEVT